MSRLTSGIVPGNEYHLYSYGAGGVSDSLVEQQSKQQIRPLMPTSISLNNYQVMVNTCCYSITAGMNCKIESIHLIIRFYYQ